MKVGGLVHYPFKTLLNKKGLLISEKPYLLVARERFELSASGL
jgi:hypothetical protein